MLNLAHKNQENKRNMSHLFSYPWHYCLCCPDMGLTQNCYSWLDKQVDRGWTNPDSLMVTGFFLSCDQEHQHNSL